MACVCPSHGPMGIHNSLTGALRYSDFGNKCAKSPLKHNTALAMAAKTYFSDWKVLVSARVRRRELLETKAVKTTLTV